MTRKPITPSDMAYSLMAKDISASIHSGALKPGDRLPSEAELAEKYEISMTSVRRGIGILVSQGLVACKHGSGTYVLTSVTAPSRTGTRDTVAVILFRHLHRYHPFFSEEDTGLHRGLTDLGWRTWVYHASPAHRRHHDIEIFDFDADAVANEIGQRKDIAGIVAGASVAEDLIPRLTEPLPVVAQMPTDVCPYVDYDWDDEILREVRHLAQGGCRRIWTYCSYGQEEGDRLTTNLLGKVVRSAAVLWEKQPHSTVVSEVVHTAYRRTMAVLKKDPEIDGIVCTQDFQAQGVIDALMRLSPAHRDRIRLACLINRESKLPTPFPYTTLVADGFLKGRALARLMHDHIVSPLTAPRRILLSCSLEAR